jgi:protein-L-isoaspartate(D-aspartate) O-methyltransferase
MAKTAIQTKSAAGTTAQAVRLHYARFLASRTMVKDERLIAAFAGVPRERFVGPGPWKIPSLVEKKTYLLTPSDDLAFLYQDTVVSLVDEKGLNNGEPGLHMRLMNALQIREGEAILHIGAGTGYYTAILAELAGPRALVIGYEVERGLAERATLTLKTWPNVEILPRSGAEGPIPECNVIYVNAGATHPLDIWLDALRPSGRLLLPMTGAGGWGAALMVTRGTSDILAARFVSPIGIYPCDGARNEEMAAKLGAAISRRDFDKVKSLRRGTLPDETCWLAGDGWWLSTADVPA